jgi:putative PIN family toxin of toxin-antitoxin system
MVTPQIVIDTNVLIAAQRSRRGASSRLLTLVGTHRFDLHVSVALVLEYEDVLIRQRSQLGLTQEDITALIDAICALAVRHKIYYQWRPYLRDIGDEFVLELAVAAQCNYIVTFNHKNFTGAERFGIQVVTPGEFLRIIGEIS